MGGPGGQTYGMKCNLLVRLLGKMEDQGQNCHLLSCGASLAVLCHLAENPPMAPEEHTLRLPKLVCIIIVLLSGANSHKSGGDIVHT